MIYFFFAKNPTEFAVRWHFAKLHFPSRASTFKAENTVSKKTFIIEGMKSLKWAAAAQVKETEKDCKSARIPIESVRPSIQKVGHRDLTH
jgi:hypothetical protein